MNNYLKIMMQLLLIWGIEMAVVWVVIHYLLPIFPETIEESFFIEEKKISSNLEQYLSKIT